MTIITTSEELTAQPLETVALGSDGNVWQHTGRTSEPWQSLTGGGYTLAEDMIRDCAPLTVLYRPDQPVSAAPTEKQIRAVIAAEFGKGSMSTPWLSRTAKAIAALYPTCQPSREVVAAAIAEHRQAGSSPGCRCGWKSGLSLNDTASDRRLWAEHVSDILPSLLPGRPESVVKAEALEELRIDLDVLLAGEWKDSFNDEELLTWIADRAAALRGER